MKLHTDFVLTRQCDMNKKQLLLFKFLAHLSRRLIWWAYRIGRPPSSIVRCMSSSTLFNHFLHRNHWASQSRMELLWDGGTKVCSNGPGHMTKMVAMPIYGKNLKKINLFLWNQKADELETWYVSSGARVLPGLLKLWLGWPWPVLGQGQIWSLMLLYG